MLETDSGPCQSLTPSNLFNASITQYFGSSSIQDFMVPGGKCPKFLVLNMTELKCICCTACLGKGGAAPGFVPLFENRLWFTGFDLYTA